MGFNVKQPLLTDIDQFNLSSASSDFMSLESSQMSQDRGGDLFRTVEHTGRGIGMKGKQGTRYSNISQGERSEGEVGSVEQSDDDVSIGENRFPGHTLSQRP